MKSNRLRAKPVDLGLLRKFFVDDQIEPAFHLFSLSGGFVDQERLVFDLHDIVVACLFVRAELTPHGLLDPFQLHAGG